MNTTTDFPPHNSSLQTLWTNMTTNALPETTEVPYTLPVYVGFLGAALCIVLYGTNFAPVKKFETGDGMFFQWTMCISLWLTGLVIQVIRRSPFLPLAMLGGFIWTHGNLCVVPIVKTIGLGLGFCIWSITTLLSGWATGRFGLFGVKKETLSNYTLNYTGVAFAICSAVIFSLVKNNVDGSNDDDNEKDETAEIPLPSVDGVIVSNAENAPMADVMVMQEEFSPKNDEVVTAEERRQADDTRIYMNTDKTGISSKSYPGEDDKKSCIDKLSPTQKRIVGSSLALFSGCTYGLFFAPAKYLQDHGHSSNGLDYVFASFSGILVTSTVYFLIYAAIRKNKPKVYPKVVIPGFISGVMWGVASSSWFVCNRILAMSVAFPIIISGPSVVASLLGVLVFREITGRKNLLILLLGFSFSITGSILSGITYNDHEKWPTPSQQRLLTNEMTEIQNNIREYDRVFSFGNYFRYLEEIRKCAGIHLMTGAYLAEGYREFEKHQLLWQYDTSGLAE